MSHEPILIVNNSAEGTEFLSRVGSILNRPLFGMEARPFEREKVPDSIYEVALTRPGKHRVVQQQFRTEQMLGAFLSIRSKESVIMKVGTGLTSQVESANMRLRDELTFALVHGLIEVGELDDECRVLVPKLVKLYAAMRLS